MTRTVLTMTQVAGRLGVSPRTIRLYERHGFITLERCGGRCLVGPTEIEVIALIERLKADLGINLSGVGVILEMRRKMMELQNRLNEWEREFDQRLAQALENSRRP
ncbi:MAG: MerR family transcriptional regulator [Thermodesulfobacteriota bacterium]